MMSGSKRRATSSSNVIACWTKVLGWVGIANAVILMMQVYVAFVTNKTIKTDQRAWVGITGVDLRNTPKINELLYASVNYANFGKEPARSVDFNRLGSFTATVPSNAVPELVPKFDSECTLDGDDADGRSTGETCATRLNRELTNCKGTTKTPPGRVASPGHGNFPLPINGKAMRANINTPDRMIIVSGCVTYLTFDEVKYSAICYFYRGGQDALSMRLCPIANDAS